MTQTPRKLRDDGSRQSGCNSAVFAPMAMALFLGGCGDVGADVLPPHAEPGLPIEVASRCENPPELELDAIPDDPSLDDDDPETVAIFEVDGHSLVGKHISDQAAAEGGLKVWRKLIARIPENQLLDLVQFEISTDQDPAAYFNRTGNITTQRYGLKLGFSTKYALDDDATAQPCAHLTPWRGTLDWSLIHEFGHLRGWVDGSWAAFLETFEDVRGPGDGYPEDGSPVLTGDFVTSYAERADGDEDHAESWTTYVMLPDSQIPPPSDNEPLALQKVRWISQQPGLQALRQALRITEDDDGGSVTIEGAPRLSSHVGTALAFPDWILGTWRGQVPSEDEVVHEYALTFTPNDMVEVRYEDGVEQARRSYREMWFFGELVALTRRDNTLEDSSGQSLDFLGSTYPPLQRLDFSFINAPEEGGDRVVEHPRRHRQPLSLQRRPPTDPESSARFCGRVDHQVAE